MPVQVTPAQGSDILVVFDQIRQGIDSKSSPTAITPTRVPWAENVTFSGGYPQRVDGSTLTAAGMVTPDGQAATLHAIYADALEGTQEHVIGCQNGQLYRFRNGAFESIRKGLSTHADLWWSHRQSGDDLVMTNRWDGLYKYDGVRCLPLGAKHIADFEGDYTMQFLATFEADETWVGGVANVTFVSQGAQSRYLESTGAVAEMSLTPSTPWSLRRGDYIRFTVYVSDTGLLDFAGTYLRFSDAERENFFTAPASAWGTLVNGWNTVYLYKDAFTVGGGTPEWSNIELLAIGVDAAGANPVWLVFDDMRLIYTERWGGGTADTTHVRQGSQGLKLTSTGSTTSMSLLPPVPWDLTSGIVPAVAGGMDYTDADFIDFWVYIDNPSSLDLSNTYVRFGDQTATNYFYSQASGWGTLIAGWNHVHILRSTFTVFGSPTWSTIALLTFVVDSTGSSTVNATFDDCYLVFANAWPKCQIVTAWKNMVLAFQGIDAPSSFHFSMVGYADAYDPNATYELEGSDGTEITGAFIGYGDVLIVTKTNSVHPVSVRLTGEPYPDYVFSSPRRLTAEHGCDSHRSIVEAGGKWYMWWQGGLYRYTGTGTERVSFLFEPSIDVNHGRAWQIVGASSRTKNAAYWYYPPNGGTGNTSALVYDYVEQAMSVLSGISAATALTIITADGEQLITCGPTGRFTTQNTGTTFDGTQIDASLVLPWASAGPPHPLVAWTELHLPYETQTAGTLRVWYRTASHPREFDAATQVLAGTIDMSTTAEYGKVFIGELGRWIQVSITSSASPFSLYWPITILGTNLGAAV